MSQPGHEGAGGESLGWLVERAAWQSLHGLPGGLGQATPLHGLMTMLNFVTEFNPILITAVSLEEGGKATEGPAPGCSAQTPLESSFGCHSRRRILREWKGPRRAAKSYRKSLSCEGREREDEMVEWASKDRLQASERHRRGRELILCCSRIGLKPPRKPILAVCCFVTRPL